MRKTAMVLAACMICSAWVFADGGTRALQWRLEEPNGWLTITDDHVMVNTDGSGWLRRNVWPQGAVIPDAETYPRSAVAGHCTSEPRWDWFTNSTNHYVTIGDRRVQVGKGEIGVVTAALGLEHGGECR